MPGSVEDVAADLDITGDAGDVLATLTSPAGTVVTLTNGNGGVTYAFFGGTTFADVGGLVSGPVSDLLATLLGHVALVAPQEPLSALLGEPTSGLWTLEITNLSGVPLTLNGWGLDLTGSTCGLDAALTQLTQIPSNLAAGSVFTYAGLAAADAGELQPTGRPCVRRAAPVRPFAPVAPSGDRDSSPAQRRPANRQHQNCGRHHRGDDDVERVERADLVAHEA